VSVDPTEPTGGRVFIALDPTEMLTWEPTWTQLDSHANLVTSYTIDRGRQYELDHTDVGRAVVSIADVNGILDPTNGSGPYFGQIEPLKQIALCRYNPVAGAWYTRYRGWIEELTYDFDPSGQVNRLTMACIDLQGVLSAVEMYPGFFGVDLNGTSAAGQIGYGSESSPDTMQDRIEAVMTDAHVPDDFYVAFTGNVTLHAVLYSPGESAMTVAQDAVDGEFPGVGNIYGDRLGRLVAHGRLARFDPVTTWESSYAPTWSSSTAYLVGDQVRLSGLTYRCKVAHTNHTPPNATYWKEILQKWDFNQWTVGDGAYVNAHPTTAAHIRTFGFNRGLSKLINSAWATPMYMDTSVDPGAPVSIGGSLERQGQHVYDTASIDAYGWRSWSAQNLLTKSGTADGSTDLDETARFAEFYVRNQADPLDRITTISFRSIRPNAAGAAANWLFLSQVDIGDQVAVYISSPGGGSFGGNLYFVEGVHEQVAPLDAAYDDVTMTLDLSPAAYYTTNPFPS
jgi:hypothetical protein